MLFLLLFCMIPLKGLTFNELDKNLTTYYVKNNVKGESVKIDELVWLRRIYIDLAGRIPTLKEITEFSKNKDIDKKEKVIDKILFSEDYVNNFYNFWADMLRIRPERLSDDVGQLKSYPYMDYVKDFIRTDKPYNVFVNELLTAKGRYTDNPATGYMLRDNGMPLDNLATTLQLFVGRDVACSQCHDDPFQDYTQKQFYEMAAFFTTLDNREPRKEYGTIIKRVDNEIKEITKLDRIDNNVRQLLASNLFNLKDNDSKIIHLPHDYKYPDAKPLDAVSPVSMDGKIKNVDKNKRDTISKWIVEHPNFSNTIVNRLWSHFVGKPLVVPQTNFDIKDYPEGIVVKYLGDYLKANNYNLKSLVRHIVLSDFYNRNAYRGNYDDYRFQAILVQRMSAYQLWDSILSFIIPDVNYSRVSFSKYSDLIELDWNSITGKDLLDRVKQIREYDQTINKNFLRYKNIELVRSTYVLNRNGFVGQFIKEYGGSDRILIDTTNDKGSITQVLVVMNSPIIELLTDKKSLIKNLSKNDLFLSTLTRNPTINERDVISKTEENDLIWSLINTREFLFNK